MLSFYSTRNHDLDAGFEEALLSGLAPDGGLYLPRRLPELHRSLWRERRQLADIGYEIMLGWNEPKLSPADVRAISSSALNFPVPLVPIGSNRPSQTNLFVLELFHGPTHSFKDVGARTMARLVSHFSEASHTELTVLVATSGDTGSAVADGFSGLTGVRVVLLYPKGQVSALQERQLIVSRPGVVALAVEGTFDDCQRMVKMAFSEPSFEKANLTSANSINIGRLLPQSFYYVHAVSQLDMEDVIIVVPSGNLGNLTAGMLAQRAGLPVNRFVAAHNANAFFPDYLASGEDQFRESIRTLSNAMDVGAPSNFERLASLFSHSQLNSLIRSTSVSDAETAAAIKRTYLNHGYVACPHTAVGLEAAERYRAESETQKPIVVLATAHPAKFPETVRSAIGIQPEAPKDLAELHDRPTRAETVSPHVAALTPYIFA